jgi:soluble lytic murein transglycosylase-like protein
MYETIITNCARVYKIDEALIRAIIKKESSWRPYAYKVEKSFWSRYLTGIKNLFFKTVTKKDDQWLAYPDIVSASYGLMQIMLTTAMELGFQYDFPFELFDPATNIKYGCLLLKKYYNRYGDWNDAIASYNQGNNRKNSDGSYINQVYVDKVMEFINHDGGGGS